MKVYIIGSSHIRRLGYICGDFDLPQHIIRIRGISGGHINDLYSFLPDIQDFKPDAIFVQIGSNDISCLERPAYRVADNIKSFLSMLNVSIKAVGLSFYRSNLRYGSMLSVNSYNYKVACLNGLLNKISADDESTFIFWKHKGLNFSEFDILGIDGVHLNECGNTRLYRSIRGFIIFADKSIKLATKH